MGCYRYTDRCDLITSNIRTLKVIFTIIHIPSHLNVDQVFTESIGQPQSRKAAQAGLYSCTTDTCMPPSLSCRWTSSIPDTRCQPIGSAPASSPSHSTPRGRTCRRRPGRPRRRSAIGRWCRSWVPRSPRGRVRTRGGAAGGSPEGGC